jgi:FixJ family two-component response regulator/anti-sigma regulatory factor (Ser/Thr protein kinase)
MWEAAMPHADLLVVDDDDATRRGLSQLFANAGFTVDSARDGAEALNKISSNDYSVVLLDIQLPGIGGMDILARCTTKQKPSKVIVMTGVDTTETMLSALRGQAYDFVPKPIDPSRLSDIVKRALSTGRDVARIEVMSARPDWVELLVPCTREAADRIQSFVQQLETDLPGEVRDSVGLAFRELLLNGIEWGGHLDPTQKVRVACLRTRRMLLYRIADPGSGFRFAELSHAAVHSEPGVIAHDVVRQEKGLRPGGFGLVLIRAIADELIYNERQNEVVFVKYLDEPAADRRQADDRTIDTKPSEIVGM